MSDYNALTEGAAYLREFYRGLYEALGRHGAHPHLIDDDPGRFTADCPVCGGVKKLSVTPGRIACDYCPAGPTEVYARVRLFKQETTDAPEPQTSLLDEPLAGTPDASRAEVDDGDAADVVPRDEVPEGCSSTSTPTPTPTPTGQVSGNPRKRQESEMTEIGAPSGSDTAAVRALVKRVRDAEAGTDPPDFEVPLRLDRIPPNAFSARSVAEKVALIMAVRLTDTDLGDVPLSGSLVSRVMEWDDPDGEGGRRARKYLRTVCGLGVLRCTGAMPQRHGDWPGTRTFQPKDYDLIDLFEGRVGSDGLYLIRPRGEREEAA